MKPSSFSNRIAVEPEAPIGRVETFAIIVKTCFGIEVLRRETDAEEVGERAGLRNQFPEVIVFVCGDDIARFVNVLRHIAVVVKSREVEQAIAGDGMEASDATSSVKRVGEVNAPEVLRFCCVGCCAVDHADCLMYEVPVIVHERPRLNCVPSVHLDRR